MSKILKDSKLKEHYLKGGYFRAVYDPTKTDDLSRSCITKIGCVIEVRHNMIISPITDIEQYLGQVRFSSSSIDGWFPEEDIRDIEPIDEFYDFPEPLPVHMYKMTYTEEKQLFPNFGKGKWTLPLVVSREYRSKKHDYVCGLANPPATKVEYFEWNGELLDDIKWKDITPKVKTP